MSLSPVLDTPAQPGSAARARLWSRRDNTGAALFISKPFEPIATAMGVIALIVVAVLFARSAGLIAALWGAGGLAVGMWLRRDRGRAYDLCFGGLLTIAIVVAEILVGNGAELTVLFTIANMVEIVLAVVLVRTFGRGLDLSTIDGVMRFLATAVLIAPIPAAAIAALGLQWLQGADVYITFLTWWFGHALGIAGVGGLILALSRPDAVQYLKPRRLMEAVVILSAMWLLFYSVFSPWAAPVGVLAVPLALLAAVRLRLVGMSIAVVLITTFAVGGSMQGYGPYATDFDGPQSAILAQILALVGYVPMLVVVGVLEERDGLTRAARAQQLRAERASEGKSRLLANVSHEIKSPIAGVIGIGELWRDGKLGPTTDSQVEMAEMLVKTARQIETLAYDLLDVSRAEAGAVSVDLRPVDVAALLEEIRRSALLRPEAQGVRIDLLPSPERFVVRADSVRLSQVLTNLTSNAAKYGKSGGVVRLKTSVVHDGWVRIAVADQGPGLSEAKQAELFEPFNRLGMEKSAVEGHGIGLALAKRLVELQHGRIGVDSKLGHGSTFWVEFPTA